MNIVLEGFDGTGKSTLAQTLVKELGLEYFWASGPPDNKMEAMELCRQQLRLRNLIIDRVTPISSEAYMNSFVDRELMNYYGYMRQCMVEEGFKFIYCVAKGIKINDKDHDTLEYQKFLEKEEPMIRARYEVIFTFVPHFRYDFTKQSVNEVIEWIQLP